jgi:flagellar hook assembly protein FlgD
LKEDAKVSLVIYNILGQKVKTLVNERQTAGYKSVLWDGRNDYGQPVSSGIYIYRIVMGNGKEKYVKSHKMVLMK